jgi:hypothetical protein
MTLTIVSRPPDEWGPTVTAPLVAIHADVPNAIARQVTREFTDYCPQTDDRFAFKAYTDAAGQRQRLVVDYELAVTVCATSPTLHEAAA